MAHYGRASASEGLGRNSASTGGVTHSKRPKAHKSTQSPPTPGKEKEGAEARKRSRGGAKVTQKGAEREEREKRKVERDFFFSFFP